MPLPKTPIQKMLAPTQNPTSKHIISGISYIGVLSVAFRPDTLHYPVRHQPNPTPTDYIFVCWVGRLILIWFNQFRHVSQTWAALNGAQQNASLTRGIYMYSGKSDGIVFPKSLAFYGKPQRKVMVWTKSDQNPLVNHNLHKTDARFELRHA